MTKKLLLFAPVTFDLAETTRMIEIAKGIITSSSWQARSSTSNSFPMVETWST